MLAKAKDNCLIEPSNASIVKNNDVKKDGFICSFFIADYGN